MTTRGQWSEMFLRTLQYPTTHENTIAVCTWIASEFGSAAPIPADNNPLATTLKHAGSTNFNKAGVQNFKSVQDGIDANVHVLHEQHPGYDAIRGALEVGDAPVAVIDAVHASAWGSKPTTALYSTVAARWPHDALLLVTSDDLDHRETPSAPAPPYGGHLLRNLTVGHGTQAWQGRMRARGWRLAVDDVYGPQSEGVCAQFQAEKGLDVDGIVGPITWAATWTAPIT